MQIIAERKLYHEETNGRYVKNFEDDKAAEMDNEVVFGSAYKK